MQLLANPTTEDEEIYAPVDKWSTSTGFLPVIAGSSPAGSTNGPPPFNTGWKDDTPDPGQPEGSKATIKSYLGYFGTLLLTAWGQSIEPSQPKAKQMG